MDRAELIERLEKLTEPLGPVAAIDFADNANLPWGSSSANRELFVMALGGGIDSVGAAIALVEKTGEDPTVLLPDALDELFRRGYRLDTAFAPQVAIALLIALLRSLDTEG